MSERLIGIDSGGTVTKVGLFDLSGTEIATEGRAVPMAVPAPGHTERDPDALWEATAEAIRALLEKTGTKPTDVIAVTASGFGAGAFFLRGDGTPSRPGIVSTDARSAELVASWYKSGQAQQSETNGNTKIFPGHTSALLGWLDANEPGAREATAHVLWCKDYLRFRLTGEISTDITDATCPGMWDYERRAWSDAVLDALGLSPWRDRLPEVGAATEVAGHVTAEAAHATGLSPGTPVARGAYDIITCSLASGVTRPDQLGMIGGTFAIASTLHEGPCRDPLPNHQSLYPGGDLCLASTASATSGSNLEWLLRTFLAAEGERQVAEGGSLYAHVNALVDEARDRRNEITFLPNLFSGQPAGLIGMNVGDTLGDVLRAVFEGVACSHRADTERLLGGKDAAKPTSMRLAGGVSKSDVWAQIFANALNMPVEVANGEEFGAKGAALCGAVAVGAMTDMNAAVDAMVRVERRFDPDPNRATQFNETYTRFQRLSDALATAV